MEALVQSRKDCSLLEGQLSTANARIKQLELGALSLSPIAPPTPVQAPAAHQLLASMSIPWPDMSDSQEITPSEAQLRSRIEILREAKNEQKESFEAAIKQQEIDWSARLDHVEDALFQKEEEQSHLKSQYQDAIKQQEIDWSARLDHAEDALFQKEEEQSHLKSQYQDAIKQQEIDWSARLDHEKQQLQSFHATEQATLHDQIKQLHLELQDKTSTILSLQLNLDTVKKEKSTITASSEAALARFKSDIASLAKEKDEALHLALEAAQQETLVRIQPLREQAASAEHRLSEALHRSRSLQVELEEARSAATNRHNDQVTMATARADHLASRVKELEQSLATCTERSDRMESTVALQLADLKREKARSHEFEMRVARVVDECTALRTELSELGARLAQEETRSKERKRAISEAEARASDSHQRWTGEVEARHTAETCLEAERSAKARAMRECDDLHAQLKDIEQRYSSVSKRLDGAEASAASASLAMSRCDVRVNEEKERANASETMAAEVRGRLDKCVGELSQKTAQLDHVNTEIERMFKTIIEIAERLGVSTAREDVLGLLGESVASLLAERNELRHEVTQMDTAIEHHQKTESRLRSELGTLRSQAAAFVEAQAKIDGLEARAVAAEKSLDEATALVASSDRSMGVLREQATAAQQARNVAEARVRRLEDSLDASRQASSAAIAASEDAEGRMKVAEQRCKEAVDSMTEAKKMDEEARRRLAEREADLRMLRKRSKLGEAEAAANNAIAKEQRQIADAAVSRQRSLQLRMDSVERDLVALRGQKRLAEQERDSALAEAAPVASQDKPPPWIPPGIGSGRRQRSTVVGIGGDEGHKAKTAAEGGIFASTNTWIEQGESMVGVQAG